MFLVQAQGWQRQLLPGEERRERVRGARTNSRPARSGTLPRAARLAPHLFSRRPFPVSRKPLANGLLSIFSCVICGGPRRRRQVRKRLLQPGLGHPEVRGCRRGGEPGEGPPAWDRTLPDGRRGEAGWRTSREATGSLLLQKLHSRRILLSCTHKPRAVRRVGICLSMHPGPLGHSG